jgi:hypothetical protein
MRAGLLLYFELNISSAFDIARRLSLEPVGAFLAGLGSFDTRAEFRGMIFSFLGLIKKPPDKVRKCFLSIGTPLLVLECVGRFYLVVVLGSLGDAREADRAVL